MEDVCQIFSRLDGEISRRGSRHCDMVWEKLYRLTLSGAFCARDIHGVTVIVFTRWSNIPAVNSVCGPCPCSWTSTLVPKGAMGVRLKSNGSFIIASADIFGFNLYSLSRFNVKLVYSINQSHNCRGNRGSNPQRIAMKWIFHVRIALSAAFARWR